MAEIQGLLDALEAKVDTETTQVQTRVASLDAEIARLQAMVDAGTATPAQVDQLTRLTAKVDAIDPTDTAVISDVPPA